MEPQIDQFNRDELMMDRRDFIRGSTLAGAALATGVRPAMGSAIPGSFAPPFTADFAPHFGMFRRSAGEDLVDQLRFMADQGFRSLEDNGMTNRPVAEQERIANEMARLDMRMGVFVAHEIHWRTPSLTAGTDDPLSAFLSEIEHALEVAKRVKATWMTVVPGHVDLRQDIAYQTANVVNALRRAADILEPHGLIIVLEPLNFRDHPGLFLNKISQAFEICRAVDSRSCKILDDLYHQQIHEGNLIPNIDLAWGEIAYFQIGDNPGRKEPTTGEINFPNVFRHIQDKGYEGILGMEHGNSEPGAEGEMAVIEAYRSVDPTR